MKIDTLKYTYISHFYSTLNFEFKMDIFLNTQNTGTRKSFLYFLTVNVMVRNPNITYTLYLTNIFHNLIVLICTINHPVKMEKYEKVSTLLGTQKHFEETLHLF